jgi:hypothetical protein
MGTPILTKHFIDRISERFPGVKPYEFARKAAECIQGNHPRVTYMGRTKFSHVDPTRRFRCDCGEGMEIDVIISDSTPGKLRFLTAFKPHQ